MSDLKSEFLFDFDALLDESIDYGQTPYGQRIYARVSGGSFEGPKLKGRILPGGGDWALIRSDGVLSIDVRATLETDAGDRIHATYGGRLAVPPEHMTAVFDRETTETIDPAGYYFRTLPLFEAASDSACNWLNNIVAVGVGRVTSRGVAYRVYAIL
ncbi:MAG: DUF3237 domain-containing protein [Alphaproteobacteria bacterium HGW-Alphaproteobacteria-12]|nr:MAG: DUF3237 domain-containing protein [Alphaproteobacteria bacterium HGW-Alphaproteobacteria-12]